MTMKSPADRDVLSPKLQSQKIPGGNFLHCALGASWVAVGLAVVVFSGCGGSARQTLTIGTVLPITGPAASAGSEAYQAVQLAVEVANASGRLAPYTLDILARDDVSDPKQAVSAAKDLSSNPAVLGIVAHFNSGCFLPASRVYHENAVTAITPAATNPEITLQGFPEIHRIVTTDQVQGEAMGRYIAQRGANVLAIIHDKTQYGEGLAKVVRDAAAAAGVTVQSFDGIQVGDKDFRSLLTTIRSRKPQAVFFGGLYDEGGLLVKQMRELGMDQLFLGPDGIKGKDFVDVAGAAAEGAIVSFVGKPVDQMASARAFLDRYEKRFGKPVENFGPYAYDVAGIFISALERIVKRGETPSRPAVLQEVKSLQHDGVIGRTEFDAKGDTKNRAISFYVIKNKQFEFIEATGESPL
ncbi:branched-chain amino acid ABC transporter substrate-binding protein [bacterium]|nr:branched-chain amino acid ABC transporter substrate-binding protein [bacterium]